MALIDERNERIAVKGKDFGSVKMNGYSLFSIHHQCSIVLKFMNFSISFEKMRCEPKEVSEVHCWRDLLRHQRIWPPFLDAWKHLSTHLHSLCCFCASVEPKSFLRNLSLHNFPFSRFVHLFSSFPSNSARLVSCISAAVRCAKFQFCNTLNTDDDAICTCFNAHMPSVLFCFCLRLVHASFSRARYKRFFDCNLFVAYKFSFWLR